MRVLRPAIPLAIALLLVACAVVLTEGDLAYVALAVLTTAFIVGGIGSGSLVGRALVYGALASLALVAFSALASDALSLQTRLADGFLAQRYTPLWSIPVAGFGVWAGHDFRRSIRDIASGR
jgi:hypothetical protein